MLPVTPSSTVKWQKTTRWSRFSAKHGWPLVVGTWCGYLQWGWDRRKAKCQQGGAEESLGFRTNTYRASFWISVSFHSLPLLEHVHEGVELVDVLLVNGQFLWQWVLQTQWKTGETLGLLTYCWCFFLFKQLKYGRCGYQVFGHGLRADVQWGARQLRRVLKFSVECTQIHRKKVVLGEGWTLQIDANHKIG